MPFFPSGFSALPRTFGVFQPSPAYPTPASIGLPPIGPPLIGVPPIGTTSNIGGTIRQIMSQVLPSPISSATNRMTFTNPTAPSTILGTPRSLMSLINSPPRPPIVPVPVPSFRTTLLPYAERQRLNNPFKRYPSSIGKRGAYNDIEPVQKRIFNKRQKARAMGPGTKFSRNYRPSPSTYLFRTQGGHVRNRDRKLFTPGQQRAKAPRRRVLKARELRQFHFSHT